MDIYDGSWKLISYDPETGRTIWYLSDNQRDVYRIDYPVSQLLDLNQACAVSAGKKRGDWQRIASVPLSILRSSHLLQAHSEGDDQWVSKWLNNRDNASWRTSEGCV
ncbi:hypothetical protein GS16_02370 [Candidatus Liberibacter solanacearum]|uniref:Uncharacterized protein n=1 Tax=Candidatus Liberibacter solanacearum TaxID=556287 RepID=A0A095A0S7_9HYPH|nr:hypothetical protein [Candidatus Liberibacter solanacearum]KGB27696.1 hypothetical protein GS16_02370 [Candidatus Liberibacter solanacearum]KJZ81182.1 hypothetical protein KP07_01400 [Candidatus Liberibacter solanacearum]KJZ81631.1 hypothetical protein DJ66_0353 [Candidatus Liberibacter solanacearum]KQC49011.1 hypothetical protein AP064_03790 [Candidatus Liberibacter solanacearum]